MDDLGRGWDVVVLSAILHHFTPTQIADLLGRVRAATTPGATVAIFELVQPPLDTPTYRPNCSPWVDPSP